VAGRGGEAEGATLECRFKHYRDRKMKKTFRHRRKEEERKANLRSSREGREEGRRGGG